MHLLLFPWQHGVHVATAYSPLLSVELAHRDPHDSTTPSFKGGIRQIPV